MLKFHNSVSYLFKLILFNITLIILLDQKTRWSSTYNMLKEFLNLWPAIKSVINLPDSTVFKKNKESLILKDTDITFLRHPLNTSSIFSKMRTKLQIKKYPTIYYLIPEV